MRGLIARARGECDTLLHPARELMRIAVARRRETDELEQFADPVAAFALPLAPNPEPELDVLPGGHVREQAVGLEHHPHVAAVRRSPRHVGAVDDDRAGGRMVEAGDEPQCGRLAAAGRSEQRDELALLELEVDPVERRHRAEHAPQAVDLEVRHQRAPAISVRRPGRPRPTSRSENIAAQVIVKLRNDTAAAPYACCSCTASM